MRRLVPLLVLAAALAIGFGAAALEPASRPPAIRALLRTDAPVIALLHARVIDGTGAPAREDQTLVIADGKIRAVGPSAVWRPRGRWRPHSR